MFDERLGLASASMMERIARCPASWNLSRGITPVRTREMIEWGESGDRIHLWLQLPTFIDLEPQELDVAEQCLEQRDSLIREIFGDEPIARFTEQRLWVTINKTKVCSGQMDFGAVRARTGLIVDYKSSYGDTPESAGNLQVRTNIVALDEFLKKQGTILEEVSGAIIQPLVSKTPQKVRYNRDELDASRSQIIDIVERAKDPGAPFKTGPHCRTCPAILICQAAKREEQRILDLPEKPEALFAGLTPAEMGPLIDAWKIAKVRGENLEAAAKLSLKQDITSVPGWTLSKGSRMRNVIDVLGFFQALKADGLIPTDPVGETDFIKKCVNVVIGRVEEELRKAHKMTWKEVKATVDATCANSISFTQKEPSLERSEVSPSEDSESPL